MFKRASVRPSLILICSFNGTLIGFADFAVDAIANGRAGIAVSAFACFAGGSSDDILTGIDWRS